MRRLTTWVFGALFLVRLGVPAWGQQAILGYIKQLPPESAEHARERHRLVAAKRAAHPLIFHRGAVRRVLENTLECYAAAIDMGADGVEIDIHRTRDGILVLHHDDKLGRTFEGDGKIKDKTYFELLQAKLKDRKGPVNDETRLPTLAAFLQLARQRAMLIHFDVKQAGIQDDIIRMIDAGDMWDHLVEVNGGNADRIRPDVWNEGKPGPHNKVKMIPYAQNVPLWDGPDEEVRKALNEYIQKKKDTEPGHDYMFFGGREHQERLARLIGNTPVEKPAPIAYALRAWWGPKGFIRNAAKREAAVPPCPRVFLMDGPALLSVRHELMTGSSAVDRAMAKLRQQAEEVMKVKPVSVMDKAIMPPSGDKHDYMSQGAYWWPNPKTDNGLPYVRRDGRHNPDCNRLDARPMQVMTQAVNTLALAHFMTGEERYAKKATEWLRVWFLDPRTKMNPHLNYGQGIPGICEGRGIGIIDTVRLARLVDSVGLLGESEAWTEQDQRSLESWFEAYLQWLLESDHGRDEADEPNNHGTYYDVQVASFALFTGNEGIARSTLEQRARLRVASQIDPDGQQRLELKRTKAWGYSLANLAGMMDLAVLSARFELDLWRFETPDGRSIRKAVDWLAQYADGKKAFEYEQITPIKYERLGHLLRRAAIAYQDERYEAMIGRLPNADLSADRMQLTDPICVKR